MKKVLLFFIVLLSIATLSFSQTGNEYWKPAASRNNSDRVESKKNLSKFKLFELDATVLKDMLKASPKRSSNMISNVVISFPDADGAMHQYRILENSNMEPGLEARYPGINSYVGHGIDEPNAVIYFSVSPLGLSTMLVRPDKSVEFIEPYTTDLASYAVYKKSEETPSLTPFECSVVSAVTTGSPDALRPNADDGFYRTFRLAMSVTGEYTAYFGGTKPLALAAINNSLTRVNGVFEIDFGIHMNLIANTDLVIYTSAATDPYSNAATGADGAWNQELQTTLTNVLGNAAYDIGHLFGASGGGGNAGCIGCVCVNPTALVPLGKGSGFTSPADAIPQGDNFDIDYVAHEMGHQFGGNHTFSFQNEGSGVQVEPGSGSTIMGYAGITGSTDVQAHSDAFFHAVSVQQITNYVKSTSCQTNTATGNSIPTASAGLDYTTPKGTPFMLTGSSTDANGDPLTYIWEQMNSGGPSTTFPSVTATSGPAFRSFIPTTSLIRYFPQMSTVKTGATSSTWEAVPNVARTMSFRFTVRDNHPGGPANNSDDMVVTVNVTAGPFTVTAPNTAVTWPAGTTQTVTWNVAGTTANGVNAANVDILLSTDGGNTYPITVLAATPNDGSQAVVIPNNPGTQNRMMVKGSSHIFFDISNTNFTITSASSVLSFIATSPLASNNLCVGGNVNVDFTTDAAGNPGNVFTAQLSNSGGSFASPVNIGTLTSQNQGTIVATIPPGTTPGSGYRIRVISSSPAVIGGDNGTNIIIAANVTPVVSISLTSGTNPTCAGLPLTFTASPTNGGATPAYQWKVNGTNAGTNSSSFTTTTLTNGQIVSCVLTSSLACVTASTATSNNITVTVTSLINPAVTISQTAGTNPQCSGASVSFTAVVSNGTSPTYQWKVNGVNAGTNSPTFTTTSLTNNQAVTCTVVATVNCPSYSSVTLGSGTATNPVTGVSTADLGNPYPTYYGNGRQQYLIRASDLTGLGLSATNINSIGFNVVGSAGDPVTMNGYSIKIGTTAATVTTTTFQTPTFTTVFGPTNYTPTLNAVNTHNFIAPFAWNGSSNLILDICFSNQVVGNGAYQVYQSNSSFVSTTFYQADGSGGAGACSQATGTTGSKRPNIIFITGSSTGTANSNSITMGVNSSATPTVSIALTSGTNPECAGASATFTATPTNGGTTPAYQWLVNGGNAGTNSPTFTTSTLTNGQTVSCVLTSNLACASPTTATSNGIPMTVNPNVTPSVSITLTSGTNPECAGASATFTATPNNGGASPSYQWKVNGVNAGTNSPTFTTTTLTNGQSVTCVLTSNAACVSPATATSNAIPMVVNANVTPSVSIALTTGTNPECNGATAIFTAAPTNGGAGPSYQWKVNGVNAGTNSATFTTTTLTNGQIVTCVLTSNAACASPLTATSNGITMTVNANVTPSISIALTTGTNPECDGATAIFTATPTNGGAGPSYQWKVNGTNAGSNSATFNTSTLTNGQTVTCELTSNATCVTSANATSNGITMTVNPNLVPSVSIALTSGTNPECDGASATFTATPINGGASPSYQWKINGTNAGTNSSTFTTTSLTNGQVVSCAMTSNAPCASPVTATSNEITMTVNAVVTASVSISLTSGSNPECDGASATFTASPTNGGSNSAYLWFVNGTSTGVTTSAFTTSTLNNGDGVTCEMTSNETCVSGNPASSNSISMAVNQIVAAGVSISASPGTIVCSGTEVTFTANPDNGGSSPSYQWKIDGTNVGTNSATFNSSTLNDGEIVTCEMISNASCVTGNPATSNSLPMTVNPVVIASVSISSNSGNVICSGTSVTFTATPVNGGLSPSYQWKSGATNVGTNSATYITSSLNNGEVITCEMTSNAPCVSESPAISNEISMTVNPAVVAEVTISANPGNYICAGASVTFTASPVNGGTTPVYQWKNGTTNVGTDNPVYVTTSLSDGDVIMCEMTSDETCVSGNPAGSNSIAMTVANPPSINTFAPVSGIPGTLVTINGSGFTGVTAIDFNGTTATFSIVNDNEITATVPAGASTGEINIFAACGNESSGSNFVVTGSITLDLKVLIEGFYIGAGQMTGVISPTVCDTIVVGLADPSSPFTIMFSTKGVINISGDGSFSFPATAFGNSYYIVVTHRNTLETWSEVPVLFNSTSRDYDFTDAASRAYGNNLSDLGGQFGLRSGDVNQDGVINLSDISSLELNAQLFSSGYISQDLNGDEIVESSDYSLIENNYTRITLRP